MAYSVPCSRRWRRIAKHEPRLLERANKALGINPDVEIDITWQQPRHDPTEHAGLFFGTADERICTMFVPCITQIFEERFAELGARALRPARPRFGSNYKPACFVAFGGDDVAHVVTV
jgi:hypothetical protein